MDYELNEIWAYSLTSSTCFYLSVIAVVLFGSIASSMAAAAIAAAGGGDAGGFM
ncbi:MAG TPA: hypothetical protein VGD08_04495 [Stellaceae bacterium]|jgi:hypothetical protein